MALFASIYGIAFLSVFPFLHRANSDGVTLFLTILLVGFVLQVFFHTLYYIHSNQNRPSEGVTVPFDFTKSRSDWIHFWALCSGMIGLIGLVEHFLAGKPTWVELAFLQVVLPSAICLGGGILKYDRRQMASARQATKPQVATPQTVTPAVQNATVTAPISHTSAPTSGTTGETDNYVVVGKQ